MSSYNQISLYKNLPERQLSKFYKQFFAVSIIFLILFLGIAVLNIISVGYLTTVAFGNKKYEDLTNFQKGLIKFHVVLFWAGIGLALILPFINPKRKSK